MLTSVTLCLFPIRQWHHKYITDPTSNWPHFAPLCTTFSLHYSTELTPLLHYLTPLAPQPCSYINSPIFRFQALKLDLFKLLICIYCCYLVVLLIHSLYVYYSLLLIYMIISITTSISTGVTLLKGGIVSSV